MIPQQHRLQSFLILALLILSGGLLSAAETTAHSTARLSIREKQLQKYIDVLADDTFEGRAAGSRGGRAAAGYLVQQLQRLKLAGGATDGKYYQPFGENSRNLLAILPGSDPTLKNEVILLGAHYDHVGYGKRTNSYGPLGYIHNGADDNASGVAGLLAVAEAITQLPQAPKRTILLAFWDGEEQGMLGSKHWVANPTVPLKQVKFMVNVDMIGRLRENKMDIVGTRSSQGLRQWMSEQNQSSGLRFNFVWELKPNSDHYVFFQKKIPMMMLHTGLHDNYHRPSDDPETINRAGLQQVSRMLFTITLDLANREQNWAYRQQAESESKEERKQFETPLTTPQPRLGVSWIDHDPQSGAIILSRVRYKSSAAAAGLQKEDRLLKFSGQAIRNDRHFFELVAQAPRKTTITVDRDGSPEPLTLPVNFPDQPSQLGLLWRSDPAEPKSVTLVYVAADSPADQAGLQVGDRLLRLGKHAVRGPEALEKFIQTIANSVSARYEREGQIKEVQIQLPSQARER